MEGLIILIVTLVAFAAMGVYIIVKLVKGPDLPDGHKFEAEVNGNKAIVIIDKKLEGAVKATDGSVSSWIVDGKFQYGTELARKCATAIHATELAFKQKGVQKADESRVVFLFSTDETFESGSGWWQAWAKGAAAYSTSLSGIFGTKRTPMAVIRTKYITTVAERGQPAVHELVHILNEAASGDYSHNHTDPKLWLGPGGEESVEGLGVQKWKELIGTPDGEE